MHILDKKPCDFYEFRDLFALCRIVLHRVMPPEPHEPQSLFFIGNGKNNKFRKSS
jgi:hypothetical protein